METRKAAKILNIDAIFENADWPKINQKNKKKELKVAKNKVSKKEFCDYVDVQKRNRKEGGIMKKL